MLYSTVWLSFCQVEVAEKQKELKKVTERLEQLTNRSEVSVVMKSSC